jgi:branched-chain amino acid transport system substrate-binding protein
MTRFLRCALLVVTAGIALSPVACGGSDKSGASGGTYHVGVPLPFTGRDAAPGKQAFQAMQVAASEINKHGGVLGRKIVLMKEDDASDPQVSVNAANKLLSRGAEAAIGSYSSSAALPAEPIYARAGIPNIQPVSNSTALTSQKLDNVFLINAGGPLQAETAAKFLVDVQKKRKIALVDDQSVYGKDLAQSTGEDIKQLGGSVATAQHVSDTTRDFSSVVSAIRSSGADAVYWTGYFSQGALFIKQIRNANLNVLFVTGDGSVDPSFLATAGAAANDTYGMGGLTGQFIKGSAVERFNSAYKKRFHSDPSAYGVYFYDALQVLAKAAEQADSVKPDRVVDALHDLKYDGLTGPISFAENGAREGGKFVVLKVVDGEYELAPQQPE